MSIRNRARLLTGGALVIVIAALVVSPAVGGPSIRKLVKKEVSKQLSDRTGPQGAAGAQGPRGPAGAANVQRIDYTPSNCVDTNPCTSAVLRAGGFTLTAECATQVGVFREPSGHLELEVTEAPAGSKVNHTLVRRNGDVADNGGFTGTGVIADLVAVGDPNQAAAGVVILRSDAATISVDIHALVNSGSTSASCEVFGTATQA
jgi:hypothetical protein